MDTVVSRCQLVRFDPLPPARIAQALEADGVEAARALACARLALGNGERARLLASDEGAVLLDDAEAMVRAALGVGEDDAAVGLLARAKDGSDRAEAEVEAARKARLEGEPKGRERTALERQFDDTVKRETRRAHTAVLDLCLTLAALMLRDLICLAEGAPEAALDADRARRLATEAGERDTRRLRVAAERCEQARLALTVNVTEDLALEALGYRLAALVGPR
jgi:DNA polymerase-3 subunit delta'